MLVSSPRHSKSDLLAWGQYEKLDAANAQRIDWQQLVDTAVREIEGFVLSGGPCYCSVSWGKDSTVLSHIVANLNARGLVDPIPYVWVHVHPIANPDCEAVRDLMLPLIDSAASLYFQSEVECVERDGKVCARGTLEEGFAVASQVLGTQRYLSGIRGQESGSRQSRVDRGLSTRNTCAPIGHWPTSTVFAYLYHFNLPVHPVYAMLSDGTMNRDFLRVSAIGGKRGRGHGREEWERRYYPELSRYIDAGV